MSQEAELFFRRYKRAQGRADLWGPILEACFHYAVPFRNRFYRESETQGELSNRHLYDATGVEATKSFVSKLHASMTPPQVQWGYLELDDTHLSMTEEEREDAQIALSTYMRRLFGYIHESNFDVVVGEAYFDLATGTASLVPNYYTDQQPLLFTSIPIDQLALEEALDGKIHTWFRTWREVKINEIPMKWHKARLTDNLKSQLRDNPDATVKALVEGVTFHPNSKSPFRYSLYEKGQPQPLFVEELDSNPGIVWRFQKTNNEWWGRGPVMEALPSMMRANEMARLEYASANLNVFRPYMGFSDGVFNPYTFRLQPMTVIPISQIARDGQLPLIPLPDASNPVFGQMTIQDLRNQINMLLYADPLGPVEGPPKTATELALRQQNLAEKIGPLFTRLQQEFLWPLIQRCMHILDKSGHLLKPKLNGQEIRFKYRSPLALAKGQQDLAILTQYVQVMQGIMGPDVTQLIINPERAPWMLAEMLQLDIRFLNSPEQIKVMAQKMADRQAQLAQQQQEQGPMNASA